MPKARLPYPPEYRRKIVTLVRAGRNAHERAEKQCVSPALPGKGGTPAAGAAVLLLVANQQATAGPSEYRFTLITDNTGVFAGVGEV